MQNEIISKNRRSATEINHKIEIRQSSKTGHYFFVAGDIIGHITEKTAKAILNDELTREDLQVADISIDGGANFFTCLMRQGSPALKVL